LHKIFITIKSISCKDAQALVLYKVLYLESGENIINVIDKKQGKKPHNYI